MNDQIHSDGSGHEHGALGDAEFAEFMELAAQEGFDPEEGGGGRAAGAAARPPPLRSAAGGTGEPSGPVGRWR
ncbi:hypothetical protein ACFWJY_17800, partial [Streptomyces anulatus]